MFKALCETINCLRKITIFATIQWSPALYLSVKQIMDESVHSVKKITVAAVFSLLTSFGLNQHGHAVLMYFFSLIYVTNVISKISEIWFSYYLASVLAWSHFWSTLLHSQMFAKKWIPHNDLLRFEWVGSKITKIWFSNSIFCSKYLFDHFSELPFLFFGFCSNELKFIQKSSWVKPKISKN